MLYSTTKPVLQLEKHRRYLKHRDALTNIQGVTHNVSQTQTIESFKKLHSQSLWYQQQSEEQSIQRQNERMYQRLLSISQRRQHPNWAQVPKMQVFNSPARKERLKGITQANNQLAMKLIMNRSQFDRKAMHRNVRDYEKLKKTLYNNKKVLNQNRLKTISIEDSRRRHLLEAKPEHSQPKAEHSQPNLARMPRFSSV